MHIRKELQWKLRQSKVHVTVPAIRNTCCHRLGRNISALCGPRRHAVHRVSTLTPKKPRSPCWRELACSSGPGVLPHLLHSLEDEAQEDAAAGGHGWGVQDGGQATVAREVVVRWQRDSMQVVVWMVAVQLAGAGLHILFPCLPVGLGRILLLEKGLLQAAAAKRDCNSATAKEPGPERSRRSHSR